MPEREGNIRVGDSLTKSTKSRAVLLGAMVVEVVQKVTELALNQVGAILMVLLTEVRIGEQDKERVLIMEVKLDCRVGK